MKKARWCDHPGARRKRLDQSRARSTRFLPIIMASYTAYGMRSGSIDQTIQNYRYQYQYSGGNINRIRHDVSNLAQRYPTLRLQGGNFTFANGKSANLLSLVGTVPIVFRGRNTISLCKYGSAKGIQLPLPYAT